jgi:plastocyanin
MMLPCAAVTGALALLVTGPVASGGPKEPKDPDKRVLVKDNFFAPRSVKLETGEVVRWAWRGENRHNVTFTKVPAGASKRGAATRRDGRWQRSFRKPGQYKYVCTLFDGMKGTITVEPAAESRSAAPATARPDGAPAAGAPQ